MPTPWSQKKMRRRRGIRISLDLKTDDVWSTHLGIMDYKAGGGNSGASDNKGGDGPRSLLRFGRKVGLMIPMSSVPVRQGRKINLEGQCAKEHADQSTLGKRLFSLIVDDLVVFYGGQNESFLAFVKVRKSKMETGSERPNSCHSNPHQDSRENRSFLLPVRLVFRQRASGAVASGISLQSINRCLPVVAGDLLLFGWIRRVRSVQD